MQNRRTVVVSLAGALVGTPFARAWAADAVFPGPVTDDTPKATVIKGTPPILDFGDGLRIPMSKAAFLTLWEGKTFWMTYGAGRSSYSLRANGEAVHFADGAMKLLLMTLAFRPDRLDHIDGCGWRLKEQDKKNYVLGDIDLPGKPFWPITDADITFGDTDTPFVAVPQRNLDGLAQVNAFCAYMVKKKDVSLAYVRSHANLL